MDGEAIRELRNMATEYEEPKTIELFGVHYSLRELHRVKWPTTTPINVQTLDGLVDFVKREFEPIQPILVIVGGATDARICGDLQNEYRDREWYAIANCQRRIEEATFPFGEFIELEDFQIRAATRFAASDDLASLLKLVGNIADEHVTTVADDGITQRVTAKTGLAKLSVVDVPNPIVLRPFRTFQEVEQPTSPFYLRLRRGGGERLPTAALFETDGGAWRLVAVHAVRDYLRGKLDGYTVIA